MFSFSYTWDPFSKRYFFHSYHPILGKLYDKHVSHLRIILGCHFLLSHLPKLKLLLHCALRTQDIMGLEITKHH